MTIINLDKNFQPFGPGVLFQEMEFPSGCEYYVKIPQLPAIVNTQQEEVEDIVLITCRINRHRDVIRLLMITDAIKRRGVRRITLFIPFVPYARADRVNSGESLSIKVFADLINSQGYEKVMIFDPHSDVAASLINNVEVIPPHSFAFEVLSTKGQEYLLVSPDGGAEKKINTLAKFMSYDREVMYCRKKRDTATGKLSGFALAMDMGQYGNKIKGKEMYIVDDICDGGGTFCGIAEMLKKTYGAKKVHLIVSHGIFSKGLRIKNVDTIYCSDSFQTIDEYILSSKKSVNQLKLSLIHLIH